MDDRAAIREFVRQLLRNKGDRADFSDAEPLAARGRLESVDTIEVLVFLEEKYGVDFAETGFDQSMVDSIDAMVALAGGE